MGIGYKIKELAELKEINLKELSRKADVSYNTLYAIVQRDNESVRPDILIKIASVLDVSVNQLLGTSRDVTTTEHELLLKRFRHLMKSDTIALYDEVDPRTGEYKRDIKELDNTYVMRSTCSRNHS